MNNSGWIGVDLDGTLAYYEGWDGGRIGAPIPLMVERVKQWLSEGVEVRIFTARVATNDVEERTVQLGLIVAWCTEHIGQALKVTNEKDFLMIALWDDRCTQVITNTGQTFLEFLEQEKMTV